MDILYYSETYGIELALGTSNIASTFTFAPLSDFLLTSIDDPDCMDLNPTDTISIPNSNAFIDLDGDCLPDLFLTMNDSTNSYYRVFVQKLIQNSEGTFQSKYCLTATQDVLVEQGQPFPLIELQDVNRDSMIDIAFFTPDGMLTVLYNQYTAMPPQSDNLCNSPIETSILASKSMFAHYPFS
jgi:hypothetical protein